MSQLPMQNWVPGCWPFHTNLLVFSPQADFQLTTELFHATTGYFTLLYSTELLRNFYSGTLLTLLITFRHKPHRKHRFHCYSPTVPRPLHRNGCLLICLLHSNGCLQNHCLAMGLYATIL
jgi:hypothetical protein